MQRITFIKRLDPIGKGGGVLALTIGIGFVFLIFGWQFITGNSAYWQSDSEDITQYIAGFNMFFSASWQHPLFAFDSLNYPEGTRVTFVDAIPLYAVFLKIFAPQDWAPFNPFGAWVALCYLLQVISAWLITCELRIRSWMFLFGLSALFILSPTLMVRLGHISLMSHWILLFSLALYLRSRRMQKFSVVAWSLLLVCSFYINIYLFVMASGIALAAFWSTCPVGFLRKQPQKLLVFMMPFVILLATLFVTLFPLPLADVGRESGFGYYAMNIQSPFIGGQLLKIVPRPLGGLDPFESFNYLGMGVIVLMVLAVILGRSQILPSLSRHLPLLIILVLYTLYAVSNRVYFGSSLLLDIPYPEFLKSLTSQFRASSRFFWPVSYAVIVFCLLVLYRSVSKWLFASSVLFFLIIQIVDLRDHYSALKKQLDSEVKLHMDYAVWDEVLGAEINNIYFYPKFRCAQYSPLDTLLPVMKYAAVRGYNLNTGYIARYFPSCTDIKKEIAESDTEKSIYVFVKHEYASEEAVRSFLPEYNSHCVVRDFAYLCKIGAHNLPEKHPEQQEELGSD